MSKERILPGEVIMDMLRGAPASGRRVAYLIETGRLFGYPENTVRVTLSRLQARGLIQSPERGRYKLAATADPVNEYVERWRLGEARIRAWHPGQWLFIQVDAADEKCTWALDALGFKAIGSNLSARPDNLSLSPTQFRTLATSIGLPDDMLIITGESANDQSWQSLWPCEDLEREYQAMTSQLRESAERLPELSQEEARLETFKLGGAGIHRLAKDPLLPAQFIDIEKREKLWKTMIEYDRQGTAIWAQSRTERDNSLPVPRLAETG